MPELPEVETVVRTLEHKIAGRTITGVTVLWPNLVANMTAEQFSRMLTGQQFTEFKRRGKFLVFEMTDKVLIVHLRMEGKFYVYTEETEPLKHTHMVFQLDQGQLHYNDTRKFGRFYLYEKGSPLTVLEQLGCEPFDDELDSEYLKRYCRRITMPIKTQLLDQGMIAGIGNIYANEICFMTHMNPNHPAALISRNKWDEIIQATRTVLSEAIRQGGTTIRSYTSSLGVTGLFQQQLHVHGKEHEPCDVCGSEIIKTQLRGRGTYYCPQCQQQKPLLLGVTGNIGTGKSTAIRIINELGWPVISCDAVNRELLEEDETKAWLAEILRCDYQKIDRQLIREAIFNDEEARKQVESLLHILIWKRVEQFYQEQTSALVFVEVPLLFETNWYRRFDGTILISSDRERIYERLRTSRGMSDEEITAVLASQMDDEVKKQMADIVIDNNGNVGKLANLIEKNILNIVKLLPGDKDR